MAEVLLRGQTIPDFTLDDIHGVTVSSRSYYMRRNLVVVLLPASVDDAGIRWLKNFQKAMESIPGGDAIALAITPSGWLETVSGMTADDKRLRFLVDPTCKIRDRFSHEEGSLQLLITNQHGVVFHHAIGTPGRPDLEPVEVPGWIEFIACRCS